MLTDIWVNALYFFSVIEGILRVALVISLLILAVKEIRKSDQKRKPDHKEWEHVYGDEEDE